MAIALIEALQDTTAARGRDDSPEFKAALAKLAMEVNSQYQSGASASSEFMGAAVTALRSLKGDHFADIRINALIDASHYFYLGGQTFSAIEPAADAVELAHRSKNPSLHRKGLTL